MYREPPENFPPRADPLRVDPDGSCRGLRVGGATAEDVLRVLGNDCQINRYATGEIFSIDYAYEEDGRYAPSRREQDTRPGKFRFAFSTLQSIEVSVYQRALFSTGNVRIGTSQDEVLAVFGDDYARFVFEDTHTLRYRGLGIELVLGADATVTSFTIFCAARS